MQTTKVDRSLSGASAFEFRDPFGLPILFLWRRKPAISLRRRFGIAEALLRFSMLSVALLAIMTVNGWAQTDAANAEKVATNGSPSISAQDVPVVKGYVSSVYAHLNSKKHWPRNADFHGSCIVKFALTRSGQIRTMGVVKSSGNPSLDAFASKLVEDAAPFPPPPPVKNFDPVFSIPFAFQ